MITRIPCRAAAYNLACFFRMCCTCAANSCIFPVNTGCHAPPYVAWILHHLGESVFFFFFFSGDILHRARGRPLQPPGTDTSARRETRRDSVTAFSVGSVIPRESPRECHSSVTKWIYQLAYFQCEHTPNPRILYMLLSVTEFSPAVTSSTGLNVTPWSLKFGNFGLFVRKENMHIAVIFQTAP